MTHPLEDILLDLAAKTPAGKSFSPAQAAQAHDPENWRRVLTQVRGVAVGLARTGKIEIVRKNKAVDPNTFKGVYRLRKPVPETPLETLDAESDA